VGGRRSVDVAFGDRDGRPIETPYRERAVFNPFGPVDGDELRYEQNTVVELARTGEAFSHTDRNVLHRVG
jgi:hypothetical protein